MGLCLLQNELCPINLNRHVIKHILSRRVSAHRFFHLSVLVNKRCTRIQQLVQLPCHNSLNSNCGKFRQCKLGFSSGSCNFKLLKNSLVQINSKLNSKPYDLPILTTNCYYFYWVAWDNNVALIYSRKISLEKSKSLANMRRGGLLGSALDSGASSPGFEPWSGTLCCVLGQVTLLSQCLVPPRCINGYRRI